MLCAARMLFQLETSCACQWPWRWPLQSPLVNRSSRRHVVRVRDTTAHLGIARNKVTAVTHGKQITCLPVAPSIPVVPLPPHLFCTPTTTRALIAHPPAARDGVQDIAGSKAADWRRIPVRSVCLASQPYPPLYTVDRPGSRPFTREPPPGILVIADRRPHRITRRVLVPFA
jgi:hypothetical protein